MPLEMTFPPWQSRQFAPYSARPRAIVAGDAAEAGSTGAVRGGDTGSFAWAPGLHARRRVGALLIAERPPPTIGSEPAQPAPTAMYCSPSTAYVIGAATAPV